MPISGIDDNRSVFLNVSFDSDYFGSYLAPLTFAIEACSFTPHIALSHDALDREVFITNIIDTCGLSINDISPRWVGGGPPTIVQRILGLFTDRLPRYNAPYELGRFLGWKRIDAGIADHFGPAALLLTGSTTESLGRYFSDVRNRQCHTYNGLEELIEHVRIWLNEKLRARSGTHAPQTRTILKDYIRFCDQMVQAGRGAQLAAPGLHFAELRDTMNAWLRDRPTSFATWPYALSIQQ
jgi:hypothetical protein